MLSNNVKKSFCFVFRFDDRDRPHKKKWTPHHKIETNTHKKKGRDYIRIIHHFAGEMMVDLFITLNTGSVSIIGTESNLDTTCNLGAIQVLFPHQNKTNKLDHMAKQNALKERKKKRERIWHRFSMPRSHKLAWLDHRIMQLGQNSNRQPQNKSKRISFKFCIVPHTLFI